MADGVERLQTMIIILQVMWEWITFFSMYHQRKRIEAVGRCWFSECSGMRYVVKSVCKVFALSWKKQFLSAQVCLSSFFLTRTWLNISTTFIFLFCTVLCKKMFVACAYTNVCLNLYGEEAVYIEVHGNTMLVRFRIIACPNSVHVISNVCETDSVSVLTENM